MANNRLYIGNPVEKVYLMVSKGFGSGWRRLSNLSIFDDYLLNQLAESDLGGKTNLIFFTEYDDIYEEAMENWKDLKKE